jgi:hypothetical protein
MANADVPLEIRQKLTGHASQDMNKHYTHLELETVRRAVESISRLPGHLRGIIPLSVALDWLNFVADAADPRAAFFLIDYPGYGICDGNPTPQSILENAEGALEALVANNQEKFRAEALCVFGHSLGGAAALQFCSQASCPKDHRNFYVHHHGRDGSGGDPNFVRATPSTSIRQREFAESDPLVETSTRHIHLSWRSGRDHPVGNRKGLAQLDPSRIRFVAVPGAHHNDVIEKALPLGLQSALSNDEL